MAQINIFKNSQFGEEFVCENGSIAKYICSTTFTTEEKYCLYVEGTDIPYWYNSKGGNLLHKTEFDIKEKLNYEG